MNKVIVPYRGMSGLGCPPNALGAVATLTPLAKNMRVLLAKGMSPKMVLHRAMLQLQSQGEKTVTPDIHAQLKLGLTNSSGRFLGALGYGGATVTSAAGGASTGAAVGSAFPVIGTAIGAVVGAVVGEAAHLMQRHVGKAEASWTSPGFYASLNTTQGRDYDEKQFSEAFKGMMDTGNNIVPGCGADRHKDPDCLLGPMAAVIAQGYLSGAVPLSATTQQVFQSVVTPWLQSNAGGLVNWGTLAKEPVQLLMMKAATDRYLAGEAMTRGDMPAYQNKGKNTPTLVQMLSPILTPANTGTAAPAVPYTGSPPISSSTVPVDQTAALIAQLQAQGATQQQAYNAAMQNLASQGIQSTPALQNQVAADVSQLPVGNALPSKNTASMAGGTSLPTWLGIGLAVVAAGFALARPQKRGGIFKRRR